jgi:hypothetical protein
MKIICPAIETVNYGNRYPNYYNSRERLKRRYLKDERIAAMNYENSSISISGLIKDEITQHRSNTFKIPWPFRIFFEMFTRVQPADLLRT